MTASPRRYRINEMFYSLQGEGYRAGTPNVFIRFSGCNLNCTRERYGFDCDTEHEQVNYELTAEEIIAEVAMLSRCISRWVIITGGEPFMQYDDELAQALRGRGYYVAVETNGTLELPAPCDYVAVSPKGRTKLDWADEVRVVLAAHQEIPNIQIRADHYFVSPASAGGGIDPAALAWCVEEVKRNPQWRLSVQQHKLWGIP